MQQVNFVVPADEKFEFLTNLQTWERATGRDARVTQFNVPPPTTYPTSPLLYICQLDDTFFDHYPKWRAFIKG